MKSTFPNMKEIMNNLNFDIFELWHYRTKYLKATKFGKLYNDHLKATERQTSTSKGDKVA